jgi:ppGpp synthetase/RelA/SpoT-type nucleotidyltranferase
MSIANDQAGTFDFEKHRLSAIAEYQPVRTHYEEFAGVVRKILVEILEARELSIHSIEARAKEAESFGRKVIEPTGANPNEPMYPNPLIEITDLAGVRAITFFPRTVEKVGEIILSEFAVIEKSDKAEVLREEEKFGYSSIHYLVRLKANRTELLEYSRFKGLIAEIQVRTILQHAWAEIEHDIQYKSVESIPKSIRRRFMSLAGMLEIGDREFQAIQDDDESMRQSARQSVQQGAFGVVEITPDALRAYLDRKLGPDGRFRDFSYELLARQLRTLGFDNLQEVDECIAGFNDDRLSRYAWGARQGQIQRFDFLLLAGMGENFEKFHPLRTSGPWFSDYCRRTLEVFRKHGIAVRSFIPPGKRSLLASPPEDVSSANVRSPS